MSFPLKPEQSQPDQSFVSASRLSFLKGLPGFLASALLLCAIVNAGWLSGPENRFLDTQTRWLRAWQAQPALNDVSIVAFDDQFIRLADEPLALFHPHLAAVLDALRVAGPKLVAFDIALPEKPFYALVPREHPDFDYDRTLLRAIALAAREFPLLLARTLDESGRRLRDVHVSFLAAANRSPFLPEGMTASASAALCRDADETIRRFPDAACSGPQQAPPLAAAMAAVQGNRQDWHGLINFNTGAPFTVVRAQDLIAAGQRGDADWLKKQFAGRAVLVGTILRDGDRHLAPLPLAAAEPQNAYAPGVMLHAQIYRSLMNQGLLQEREKWATLLLVAGSALFWFGATSRRKTLLLLVFIAATVAAGLWEMLQLRQLPSLAMLTAAASAFLLRALLSAWDNWQERLHLNATFSGHASPQLMRRLQSGEIAPGRSGVKASACVLFADVRDFTSLSETLPPEQAVLVLNDFFSAMTAAVHRHGGIVDKFIGDGMMALFGQPEPLPAPEKAALEAAHEMLIRLAELNRSRFAGRGLHLQIGIGIHSGDVVLGFLGARQRHDYTAIGDTVNTASRLEGLSRTLNYPIICSEKVAAAVGHPDFLADLGVQAIKGHSSLHLHGWQPKTDDWGSA